MRIFARRFLTIFLLIISGVAMADDDQGHIKKTVGNWEIECAPKVCLLILTVTNAGDNTTFMKIIGDKPDNFGFMVSGGDIDESKGIVVTFAKTTIDSSRKECAGGADASRPADCYHIELLDKETFNGPFTDCDAKACIVKIPGQYIGDKDTPGRIDLLEQFENDSSLFLMYEDKQGTVHKKAVAIDGFKDAYNAALDILK